jgi:hypothetical protein
LPPEYAALQQLQVLKASRTNISGVLPASYGLLKSLVELDVSDARLQGTLPSEWADPFGLRIAATSALQAAKRIVSRATKIPADLSHLYSEVEEPAREVVQGLQQLVDGGGESNTSVTSKAHLRASEGLLLNQLQVLRLRNNNFSGDLPTNWHLLPSLRILDVSVTSTTRIGGLTGPLPSRYALMQQLQVGMSEEY